MVKTRFFDLDSKPCSRPGCKKNPVSKPTNVFFDLTGARIFWKTRLKHHFFCKVKEKPVFYAHGNPVSRDFSRVSFGGIQALGRDLMVYGSKWGFRKPQKTISPGTAVVFGVPKRHFSGKPRKHPVLGIQEPGNTARIGYFSSKLGLECRFFDLRFPNPGPAGDSRCEVEFLFKTRFPCQIHVQNAILGPRFGPV